MLVKVAIKPNSKHREEVVGAAGGALTVYTKSPAIEGRANEAAVRLLADHFGVSQGRVKLVRGHRSKYKVFDVAETKT